MRFSPLHLGALVLFSACEAPPARAVADCPGMPPRDSLVVLLAADEPARILALPETLSVAGHAVGVEAWFHRDGMPQLPLSDTGCVSMDRASAAVRVTALDGDTLWRPPVQIDSVVFVAEDSAWTPRHAEPTWWRTDTLRAASRLRISYFEPSNARAPIIVAVRIVLPDGRRVWLRGEPVVGVHTM